MKDVCIVYLPSPPGLNVFRDWAGGYGTALPSAREYAGHDQEYFDVPFLQFLYIARRLQNRNLSVMYANLQAQERFASEDFLRELERERPKLLISALSLPTFDHDLRLLQTIRERFPAMRILLIGSIAKLFKDTILNQRRADYIIIQDEEFSAAEVAAAIIAGNRFPEGAFYLHEQAVRGTPIKQRMQDLNFVDFPAYDLLDFTQYESTYPFDTPMRYTTMFTSRGCPFPCSYCPYPLGFGKKPLFRDPALVLADIEKLIQEFQVELLVFRDQVFTLNKTHCKAILHGIIEKQLKFSWLCETRYDLVDPDLLRLMAQAGCREINYGLESGDETLFRSVAKAGATRGLDYFGEIIQATKDAGMRCHTHLMLGLPDDSRKSIRHTIKFLKTYRPDSVQIAIFIPYPGTPLGDDLAQRGVVKNLNYEDYTGFQAVIPTKHMSIDEVNEARAHIYHVWDKSLPQRALCKLRSWTTLRHDTTQ